MGACYLSPDEQILLVYSGRRFLGENDYQLDFYEAGTGRYLHGLNDVRLGDFAFRQDGRRIFWREVYAAPKRSKKVIVGKTSVLDAFTGAMLETVPDDGALVDQGARAKPVSIYEGPGSL